MIKCLLSRPGLIAGPLHSTPIQIISQSIPRLDPIDSKSSLHFRPVFSTAVKGWIRISVSLDEFSLQQKINITNNILNIHTHSRIHPYPLVSGLLDPSGPVMAPLVKVLLCHRRHELWVLHPVLLTRHHAVLLLLTSVRK